jgi:hypothetical protein
MGFGNILKKATNFIPGVGPIISTGLDVASDIAGASGEKKRAEAGRESNAAALKLKQQMGEDSRLGHLGLGSSMAPQLAGKGFMVPGQDVLSQLKTRRNYDPLIEKAAGPGAAGVGSSFLQGLLGTAGDIASQYDMGSDMTQPTGSPTLENLSGINLDLEKLGIDPRTGEIIGG